MDLLQLINNLVKKIFMTHHNDTYFIIGIGVILLISVSIICIVLCEYIVAKLIRIYLNCRSTKTYVANNYSPVQQCEVPLELFKPVTIKEIPIIHTCSKV